MCTRVAFRYCHSIIFWADRCAHPWSPDRSRVFQQIHIACISGRLFTSLERYMALSRANPPVDTSVNYPGISLTCTRAASLWSRFLVPLPNNRCARRHRNLGESVTSEWWRSAPENNIMVDCGNSTCVQERRLLKKELLTWTKKVPLLIGK